MLEIINLTILVNGRYIIKDLSLTINKGDKLAIIGEEGNGKSTLLKTILSMCDYGETRGTINLKGNRVGYLEQVISGDNLNKKVYDYLFSSEEDYYNKISELYKYLELFNLEDEILEQRIMSLSGGEK